MLTDLRRATQYEVQVRARTMAGYGSFSPAAVFRTLPDGKKRPCLLLKREFHTHYCFFFPLSHIFVISIGKVFQILSCTIVAARFVVMNLLPVSLYLVSVLVLSLFNIINSCHVLSFLSHTFLHYQWKPPSHDFCRYITLTLCLPFFPLRLFQDKTQPPSSWYPASLSLSGCCCLSLSSLWLPTAYGENRGKGKRQRKRLGS